VDVPNVRFIMVGDMINQRLIEKEAMEYGIYDKFEFTGYKNDIREELERFNVFAYPLNPWHFGSTENAILEALASGIPVVALNQCAEKYLIEHMKTGFLANDKKNYAELIRYIYENPDKSQHIANDGKEHVLNTFSMEKNVKNMNFICDEVMSMGKDVFDFNDIFGDKPYKWFLSCLGADKKLFQDSLNSFIMSDINKSTEIEFKISNCRHILKEDSKSSINHFLKYFPSDKNIGYWKNLISKNIY
jgi:hypothetical protein